MVNRGYLKRITTLLMGLLIALTPVSDASAYSSPYYATRFNTGVSIGFQASQVIARGNAVYVASYSDCYVHKIVNGNAQTVAGIQGSCGYSADGSVASSSRLQGPSSIDVGPDGTVYIAEPFQHHIRAVLPNGTLATIAGNGTVANEGSRTDAPDAKQTAFNSPAYVKLGPDNALYTYDQGVIRRILPDGSTDHVAGGFNFSGSNNPYVNGGIATEHAFGQLQEAFSTSVNGASWSMFDFDPEGTLFATSGGFIYKINLTTGIITTYYTPPSNPANSLDDAPLSTVNFGNFTSFDIDSEGQLWGGGGTGGTGPAILYVSPTDQIARTAAGGGTISNPPVMGTGSPLATNNLKLETLRSVSVDGGQVYYISKYTDNVGRQVYYVGKLSTSQDSSPPNIQPQLSSPADSNGWNSTPVTLNWSVNDPESSVVNTSGCNTTLVSATSGTTFTCTATSGGGTTSQSITVKVDVTQPIVQPHLSPAPNANGWNNSVSTITWEVSDTESPITNMSNCGVTTITTDSSGTTYSCTATSGGGTTTQSMTVKTDTTAPTTSAPTMSGGITIPFLGYLFFANATTLHANINDTLSGVVAAEYYIDSDPGQGNGQSMTITDGTASASVSLTSISGQHRLYVRSLDAAGNWSTATGSTFLRIGL